MAKITYEDKEFLNKNENIADKNKVNDTDLNQIKEVVNNTYYADYSNNNICTDANKATEIGGYYTNSTTLNLPWVAPNASSGYLNVMSHFGSDLNSVTQIWTRYKDGEMYIRHWYSFDTPEITSGWGEWNTIDSVEVGSNSNGTWRKYANGDMECWFIQQVSVAINAQWGSLYVGTASLHDFPQTFTEIPVTQISFAPNGNQALIGRTSDNSLTKSNPGKIALFRGNTATSVRYKIHVYAKGRWK